MIVFWENGEDLRIKFWIILIFKKKKEVERKVSNRGRGSN